MLDHALLATPHPAGETATPLLLAQEALPLPGEGGPNGATSQTPGGGPGGQTPTGDPFGGSQFLLVVFVLVAAMIIFSIFGQRRDRKKRDAMLSALKKHDKVQTIGGVIGSIVEVKKDLVVLKVDESANTRITFARSAIQQVLGGEEPPPPALREEKS